jgi:hypothetical protein
MRFSVSVSNSPRRCCSCSAQAAVTQPTSCIFPSICGLNAVSAGSIHIEISRSPPSSCTGTQTQYRLEPVMEFPKLSVQLRIFPSFRETNQSSSPRNRSRQVKFNLSGGRSLQQLHEFPLARVCLCSARASRFLGTLGARLANRGVPGRCCYLEVLVLVFCFRCILVLIPLPYPSWVGIIPWIP